MNGLTIGSSLSGATGRANADTQALFVYLWTVCPDARCPVLGGRGANGLADFNANKQLTLPDMRGRIVAGLDDMGSSAGGFFSGVPFSGTDTATTPGGLGGENIHTLTLAEAPQGQFTLTDPGHHHQVPAGASGAGSAFTPAITQTGATNTSTDTTGITIADHAGGGAHNNMSRFSLGTWYMRL
jgi:hypothetical protein